MTIVIVKTVDGPRVPPPATAISSGSCSMPSQYAHLVDLTLSAEV